MLVQVVRGLKALHSRNILHRDIKSANIFVTGDNVVQLGDLNVAKVVHGLAYTQTGTPYYASPEV
jgi:Serine/threonine protein kinase